MTTKSNLIVPEVMADMISAELPAKLRFAPLATIDNTLEGKPGDTVTVPKYGYIGDAVVVAEGQPVPLRNLTTTSQTITIHKIANGTEITDEAKNSAYGNPVEESKNQLTLSIANAVDNEVFDALKTATTTFDGATAKLTVDVVQSGIDLFNDEEDEVMVLLVHPQDISTLRKSDLFTRQSALGDAVLIKGTDGEILGAQVVRSKKITRGNAYLVKPGALAIYMKEKVQVETDRDIVHKKDVITADQHYGVALANDSRVVKLKFTV